MAAKKASTYLTGGGGFNFEDAIAAHYLVMMLSQRLPFEHDFGALRRIKWQGSDEAWELDDLVISGEAGFEAGMSIKSEAHLKTTGFSQDFAQRCWRQLHGTSGRTFNAAGDLLERLAIVGTRPDEHWRNSLSPQIVSQAGPWRTCNGRSLAAALTILVGVGEISTEVVPNVIVICEMVLRRYAIAGDVPDQTSRDAAELVCRIARCLVTHPDSRHEYRGCREDIYRSMLVAAAVNPAEATELALYAAQRRALPEVEGGDDLAGGDIPELESVPHGLLDSLLDSQETAEPWPDGPLDRVDESFQTVCLETDALIPLIQADPAIAKEVLLACCIEEPQSRGHRGWGSDDEIGVVERVNRREPLFDVGPFLPFFRMAPNEAVGMRFRLGELLDPRDGGQSTGDRISTTRKSHQTGDVRIPARK